jgi:hypothetical protein
MLFQRVVVNKILLLPALAPPVAEKTPLVFFSAVCIELVIAVKPLSTETALWVALESALVDGAGVVVAKFLVFL